MSLENCENLPACFPIAQLCDRYHLSDSVLSKRRKDLGILPQRVGFRSFITSQQLALLDELHEFIQGGGTTAEFLFFKGFSPDS